MSLDTSSTLGQLAILVLIMLFAAFTVGLVQDEIPPLVSQWFSRPVHASNLSTTELSERILQPSDLPGNYSIVERRERDVSEISAIARELGWKRGFIVRYQLSGSNGNCGPSIQQIYSVYPAENITRALPHPQYHRRMAQENNEKVQVDELPVPGIGDESTATKIIQKEYTCSACLVDFIKNDVYSQVMVYGPAPDCESAKKLAAIAAAKIN